MNTITINGNKINTSGKNITITKNAIIVDNIKIYEDDIIHKIEFIGDLASLECHTATINGNVNGDVNCHTLICEDIYGQVDAHNILCESINKNN